MRAGPLSLSALFDPTVRYTVPLFQRGYVWDPQRQWEPLWTDLQVQADGLLADTPTAAHFLGAVVLDQQRNPTGSTPVRHIIDGQQRLTTLQLLLAAARDQVQAVGAEQVAQALDGLIRNNVPLAEDPAEVFKVWPTNIDRPAFRLAMTSGSPPVAWQEWEREQQAGDDGASARVLEAYEFFALRVGDWLAQFDSDKLDKASRSLYGALHSQFEVVSIDLDRGDDAQAIFETLNDRATPLSASDLVKNLLFQTADRQGLPVESLHDEHWRPFGGRWWRAEQTQGRYKRLRLDIFLSHYLAWLLERDVTVPELYSAYRGMLAASDENADWHLADLSRAGRLYRGMLNEPFTAPEGQVFYRLRVLDTTTVLPLLLELYSQHDQGRLDRPQLRRALVTVDSYLIRRLLCQLTTKNYNRIFIQALRAARESTESADEALVHFLADLDDTGGVWPDDAQLETAVMAGRHYGNIRADRIRVVLEALEAQLRGHFTEPVTFGRPPTVEHLLPRKWQQHWPLSNEPEAYERRRQAVDNLGNLTLLMQPLNSSVSHGPWPAKREAILAHSALTLNRDLPAAWDEDTIESRCRTLISAACEAWPPPPKPD